MMQTNNIIPIVCVVKEIIQQTEDVKTFRLVDTLGKRPFDFMPGQCVMISVPSIASGESMISITSSPDEKNFIELSVKNVGQVTSALHSIEVGQNVLIRGPLGNSFPVDSEFLNKDIIIIGGGIGIAPVRSVINHIVANRDNYKSLTIVYGVKNEDNFVNKEDIDNLWANAKDTRVCLTIDRINKNWSGNVGFVPDFVEKLNLNPSSTVVMCGPPIMIKLTLERLLKLGFEKTNIYTTLEMRMKCGIGKCGRCNIGNKYVCKDGPVFRMDQLEYLPDEY